MQSQTASPGTGTPPATTNLPATTPPATTPPPVVAPERATYAGRTSGNEATIAIAVQGGQAAASVCDDRRVEAWLHGIISGEGLNVFHPLPGHDVTLTGKE